jgi:hypothetical protein
MARRAPRPEASAVADGKQSDNVRRASDSDAGGERSIDGPPDVVAQADTHARPLRFIPDWLRFGDPESVPLPAKKAASGNSGAKTAAGVEGDFQ